MRLAAVPVCYHEDLAKAMEVARLQSLTTHQGEEAAECCRLMTFLMLRGYAGDGNPVNVLDATGFTTPEASVQVITTNNRKKGKEKEKKERKKENDCWEKRDLRCRPTLRAFVFIFVPFFSFIIFFSSSSSPPPPPPCSS